jgi:hypothetical protein
MFLGLAGGNGERVRNLQLDVRAAPAARKAKAVIASVAMERSALSVAIGGCADRSSPEAWRADYLAIAAAMTREGAAAALNLVSGKPRGQM